QTVTNFDRARIPSTIGAHRLLTPPSLPRRLVTDRHAAVGPPPLARPQLGPSARGSRGRDPSGRRRPTGWRGGRRPRPLDLAATIRALKAKLPQASVEVLTPDFLGVEEEALRTVLAARPEVFNHNIETARRLHARMRGAKASYDKALWLLARAKELADYPVLTKSGIIVGLGETNGEVVETMSDLREHGVDVVTIGQYLQPSAKHAKIDRWVHPDEFR